VKKVQVPVVESLKCKNAKSQKSIPAIPDSQKRQVPGEIANFNIPPVTMADTRMSADEFIEVFSAALELGTRDSPEFRLTLGRTLRRCAIMVHSVTDECMYMGPGSRLDTTLRFLIHMGLVSQHAPAEGRLTISKQCEKLQVALRDPNFSYRDSGIKAAAIFVAAWNLWIFKRECVPEDHADVKLVRQAMNYALRDMAHLNEDQFAALAATPEFELWDFATLEALVPFVENRETDDLMAQQLIYCDTLGLPEDLTGKDLFDFFVANNLPTEVQLGSAADDSDLDGEDDFEDADLFDDVMRPEIDLTGIIPTINVDDDAPEDSAMDVANNPPANDAAAIPAVPTDEARPAIPNPPPAAATTNTDEDDLYLTRMIRDYRRMGADYLRQANQIIERRIRSRRNRRLQRTATTGWRSDATSGTGVATTGTDVATTGTDANDATAGTDNSDATPAPPLLIIDDTNKPKCGICHEETTAEVLEQSSVFMKWCRHRFHVTCLFRMFAFNITCPFCRDDVMLQV
jgi:Ring finger domain